MSVETDLRKLLESIWPRRVFVEVAKTVEHEGAEVIGVFCFDGNAVVSSLISQIAGALFNLFAGKHGARHKP